MKRKPVLYSLLVLFAAAIVALDQWTKRLILAADAAVAHVFAAPQSKEADTQGYLLRQDKLGEAYLPLLKKLFSAEYPKAAHDVKPLLRRLLALEQPTLLGVQEALFHQLGAVHRALPPGRPALVVLEQDMAKALGLLMKKELNGARPVVCLDGVRAEQGDYVDLGRPVLEGLAIPVVGKTLLFG